MSESERIVHEVAERVRALIAEAEERAAEIVREAEREAKRIRVDAEAESRARLEQVRRALDDLEGRLGPLAEVEPGPAVVPDPQPPDPPPAPDPEPEPPPEEGTPAAVAAERGEQGDEAGARLVAMDLALEGADREAIMAEVGEGFGLDDPAALVDEVLARTAR